MQDTKLKETWPKQAKVYVSYYLEIWRKVVVLTVPIMPSGTLDLFYSIIFSMLAFLIMLIASKMAAVVTDITFASKVESMNLFCSFH